MAAADLRSILADSARSLWVLTAIASVYETGLVAELAEPRTVDELSERSHLPPWLVRRLLDVLVALELAHEEGGRFAAGEELAGLLRGPTRHFYHALSIFDLLKSQAFFGSVRNRAFDLVSFLGDDPDVLWAHGILSAP